MKFEPDDMPLKTMPLLPLSGPVKFSVAPARRVSEPPLRMPLPAEVARASVFSPIAAVTEPIVSVPPLTLPRLSCKAPPCKVIGWLPKSAAAEVVGQRGVVQLHGPAADGQGGRLADAAGGAGNRQQPAVDGRGSAYRCSRRRGSTCRCRS